VLIVGSGAAAMAAAVGVVQAGSSVILLEKAAAAGGTTIKSDGAYWIPNNHLMRQRGCSIRRTMRCGTWRRRRIHSPIVPSSPF